MNKALVDSGLCPLPPVPSICCHCIWRQGTTTSNSMALPGEYVQNLWLVAAVCCPCIYQSLKKITILRGAIFAQISPFCAKSQFFTNFALVRNFCANLRPCGAQFFAKFANFAICLQFARRSPFTFSRKSSHFLCWAGAQITFAQIGLHTVRPTSAKFT